ncbi:fibulin-2 [Pelodytes ibericus]
MTTYLYRAACWAILLLTQTPISLAQKDCASVECQPPTNCIEEEMEEGSCCVTCAQLGCTCEGYQYYDCLNVGFKDGKVPEGESYFVDFGSTECSCPPGGGRISCHFIPCPEVPPNCIDIIQPADGCVQCGRIGCIHGEEKYEAGHTFHISPCKVCHCPNSGGDLMCYDLPECELDLENSSLHTDHLDSDKQYDYPYSQEQEGLENTEIVEKTNNYKRNAMQDHSILDYEDNMEEFLQSVPTTVYPMKLVELTTSGAEKHLSSQYESVGMSMINIPTTSVPTTSVPTSTPTTSTTSTPTTSVPTTSVPTTSVPTTSVPTTSVPTSTPTTLKPAASTSTQTSANRLHLIRETTTKPMDLHDLESSNQTPTTAEAKESSNISSNGNTPPSEKHWEPDLQTNATQITTLLLNKDVFPKEEERGNISSDMNSSPTSGLPADVHEDSQSTLAESNTQFTLDLGKGGLVLDSLDYSRLHNGSSKDLVEVCCAEGQQWSIDHGECESMPDSPSEECRLARKQCCISYMKENTCIAGMIAAKEDAICFPAENDMCERSYFKLCCDCCSLGLKIKKEGDLCESSLNLGYPCNHMMVLCCNGEEQMIPLDIKIPLRSEPTVATERDSDECALNTHTCVKGERCINTFGSFLCIQEAICETGYILVEGACKDINECAASDAPCKEGFHCVNTVGSYVCQRKHLNCKRGFVSDENGTICLDINECKSGANNCSSEESCYNLPGSYRCDCKTGYRYDSFRKKCVDVNECWIYPGRLCHHTCENTPGSYTCSCFAGFQLSNDGKHCEDVNECEKNPCSQECTNVYGSYQCYCKEGYKLSDDGRSCEDIDECMQGIGSLCIFACVNTPGSYQCACPENGYTMSANGLTCKDIDECEVGSHNCSSSEECYNIHGGYKCLSFQCPENYRKSSNMKCERINCFNYQDCQNTPIRISYHRLNFPVNVIVPAQIFRIGPSPAYSGDSIILEIKKGNEENYFSARKFNPYTGILYLQRPVKKSKEFLLDVEMRLFRKGVVTTFLSRIYIFITAHTS